MAISTDALLSRLHSTQCGDTGVRGACCAG